MCVSVCVWEWMNGYRSWLNSPNHQALSNIQCDTSLNQLFSNKPIYCALLKKHTVETQVWMCEVEHQPWPSTLIFNDSISETIAAVIQRVKPPAKQSIYSTTANRTCRLWADQHILYMFCSGDITTSYGYIAHLCATSPVQHLWLQTSKPSSANVWILQHCSALNSTR